MQIMTSRPILNQQIQEKDVLPSKFETLAELFLGNPIVCVEIGETENHLYTQLLDQGITFSEIHLVKTISNDNEKLLSFLRYGYYSNHKKNDQEKNSHIIYTDNTIFHDLALLNITQKNQAIDLFYVHTNCNETNFKMITNLFREENWPYCIGLSCKASTILRIMEIFKNKYAVISFHDHFPHEAKNAHKDNIFLLNKDLHSKIYNKSSFLPENQFPTNKELIKLKKKVNQLLKENELLKRESSLMIKQLQFAKDNS